MEIKKIELFNTYPSSSGGLGPNGFEPSQKQSIGVIQTHGIILSSNSLVAFTNFDLGRFGGGGLKQISARDQFLKIYNFKGNQKTLTVHINLLSTVKFRSSIQHV
jgi:hypothetical protein